MFKISKKISLFLLLMALFFLIGCSISGNNAGKSSFDPDGITPGTKSSHQSTDIIQAEDYDGKHGCIYYSSHGRGYMGFCNTYDWLRYNDVDFGTGDVGTFIVNIARGDGDGDIIRIVIDGNNEIARLCPVEATGSWWTFVDQSVRLNQVVTGVHDVWLKFDRDGTGNIDYFKFENYEPINLDLQNMTINNNEPQKDFTCSGYILAESFNIINNSTVTFNADDDNFRTEYIKLGSGFRIEKGSIFIVKFGN